jgi:hypothetical protein
MLKTRILSLMLIAVLCIGVSGLARADAPALSKPELELLLLINQARTNPLGVAAFLGMDPEKVLADLPELGDILTGGLPPLGLNENLVQAARAHTADMLDNNFYSHDSLDGRSPYDRILQSGYEPATSGESLGLLAFGNFMDQEKAMRVIFANMFEDELNPARTEKRNILDPDLREVGLCLGMGALKVGRSFTNAYVLTCDFGARANQAEPYLTGVVYQDLDQDGLYSPGEGLPGRNVLVYGAGLHLTTDAAGGFNVPVEQGGYWVILFSQTEDLKITEVNLSEKNQWVGFATDAR